jgi:hydroxyacylglutathione hydrolase
MDTSIIISLKLYNKVSNFLLIKKLNIKNYNIDTITWLVLELESDFLVLLSNYDNIVDFMEGKKMNEMTPEVIFGTYTSWKYDRDTWIITALDGSLYMYLLEGRDYSLLIDTAYGFGYLRNYVEKLTDKPVLVVNTHGHLDHAGGNGEWEKVYMHKNAVIDQATFEGGPCDISKLPYPEYEKEFISEGDVFKLGERNIEVIDISAHSNGSLAFLDASHKLMYTGDEIESAQVLMYEIVPSGTYDFEERIRKHKASMEKLQGRSGEFDFLCPAHNGTPIAKEYLNDYIKLSESILDGTAKIEDKLNHKYIEMSPLEPYLCRARYSRASFIVKKEDVRSRFHVIEKS